MSEQIPLTEGEEKLMDEFYEEITGGLKDKRDDQKSALVYIKDITDKYLRKGIRLNVRYGNHDKTVRDSIFDEVIGICNSDFPCEVDEERALEAIVQKIAGSLVLESGSIGKEFITELANHDYNYVKNLNKQYGERQKKLEDAACEGILKDRQAQKGKLEVLRIIDNGYCYMGYSQDSIINPAKILNNKKVNGLNLRVSIIRIGESVVNVEKGEGGKRNYKDVLEGGIELSFATEVGKISIYLYRIEGNSDEVKAGFADEESEKIFNNLNLKDKSNLGKNCYLGGKSVSQAITDKCFKRNVVELTETVKDIPSAVLNQVKQENHNLSLSSTQTPN